MLTCSRERASPSKTRGVTVATHPSSDNTKRPALVNLGIAGLKLSPKLVKIGLALGSVIAYSYLFTWLFALIIVTAVFIHECGHLFMMKRYGLRTKGIYLIPFFGGAAVAEKAFPSRQIEAITALTGPAVGLGLSAIGAGLYFVTGNPIWAAAANWNALINLFNLLPVTPLDGGRVIKSVVLSLNSRLNIVLYIIMTVIAAYVMVTQQLWIFILLLVIGTIEFFHDRKKHKKMPAMKPRVSWLVAAAYILLVAALWGLMLTMASEPGAALAMQVLKG